MRKFVHIVLLCFILGVSLSFGQAMCGARPITEDVDILSDSGVKIEDVLKDFFEFSAKSKSKDPELEELLKNFKSQIENRRLNINFGSREEDIFDECMAKAGGPVGNLRLALYFNKYLLENYQSYPSIMYTSLVSLASKYCNDYKKESAYDLPIDREVEACMYQAKYIDKYLSKSKLKLTSYEKALLASYKDNNLYDFLFKYYAIDAEWLDYLKEVFSSENTAKGKLKQLRDIGDKKIEESKLKLKAGISEEEIYYALVMPAMYCELVPYYVYNLTDGKSSGKSPAEYAWAAVDPKLAETMTKLKEIIAPFLSGLEYKEKLRQGISKIPVQK